MVRPPAETMHRATRTLHPLARTLQRLGATESEKCEVAEPLWSMLLEIQKCEALPTKADQIMTHRPLTYKS